MSQNKKGISSRVSSQNSSQNLSYSIATLVRHDARPQHRLRLNLRKDKS